MIELRSMEQLAAAAEHARREAKSLVVRVGGGSRQYVVANRAKGTQYTVTFVVRRGRRFGRCTCTAGKHGVECKHLAAAAALNSYRASQGLLSVAPRASA